MNLLTYFPNFSELTDAQVQDMRTRLAALWKTSWPDLDTRPGSVFGDGTLTPLAYLFAAAEIAGTRIQSDLLLKNVADNIIWNCDFVREFLKNFGAVSREGLPATGIVRFTFSADAAVEINRGIKIRFGNSDTNTFYARLPAPGPILIQPVGSPRVADQNVFPLIQLSDTSYAADIPVTGQMEGTILAEDTADVSETIEGLTSVTSLVDFDDGQLTESLSQLAEKTRKTFHSASFNQRHSAQRFLLEEFPDLYIASVVMPGDSEMMRGNTNPLGFTDAVLDVHVRSRHFQRLETQTVRLAYVSDQEAVSVDRFIGQIDLGGVPLRINSITYAGNADLNLNNGTDSLVIYTRSRDGTNMPLLSSGMSMKEELWFSIKMPRATDNTPLIIPDVDLAGEQYAFFTIAYQREPMVPVLSDYLESSNIKPAGMIPLVRSVLPIVIDTMTVRYRRKAGSNVNFEAARQDIVTYLAKAGYPDTYNEAQISEIMYYAGAARFMGIDCIGRLRWTVADKVLPADAPDPDVDLAGAEAVALSPVTMEVRSDKDFLPVYRDLNAGTDDADFASVGERSSGILVNAEDIFFKEEL